MNNYSSCWSGEGTLLIQPVNYADQALVEVSRVDAEKSERPLGENLYIV